MFSLCRHAELVQMLVVALVHSRLDYDNSVLVGIPAYLLRRLQSMLNAAARLIFHLKRSDHITDALVSLHWLRVPERIQYKVAVLGYRQGSNWTGTHRNGVPVFFLNRKGVPVHFFSSKFRTKIR